MKYIHLLRHADAVRGTAEMNDHVRPLSEEGVREASETGAWLQQAGIMPDAVMCSTAERARETLDALGIAELALKAEYLPQLYLASPGEILQAVQGLNDSAEQVLVVGHNPGLRDFCNMFVRSREEHTLMEFKTAAVATLHFPHEQWQSLPGDGGKLERYREPQ